MGVVGRGLGQHKGDHWPIERQNEVNTLYFRITYKKDNCKCKRKMTPMSPPHVNHGVASSSSWPNSICYPKMNITRIGGALKTTASCQRRAPSTCVNKLSCNLPPPRATPRFPDGWLKFYSSHQYPHYNWVDHR
jgi:hypothetical protein